MNADAGTYALILFLPRAQTIRVGALGQFRFPRGWYVYIGSALNGLEGRVARHVSDRKKLFWHIDYFRQHARVVTVEKRASPARLECRIARRVLARPDAQVSAPRFGSSDCDCATHLIYFPKRPSPVFDFKFKI